MISLDCETSGLDIRHGCRPFFVTTCTDKGYVKCWDWEVDPLTRKVNVIEEEVQEIQEYLFTHLTTGPLEKRVLVTQNGKFDIAALYAIGFFDDFDINIVWECLCDTLIAGHLLGSNRQKDLTSLAYDYLGVSIEKYEVELGVACNAARRISRSKFPDWKIAKEGMKELPSAKGSAKLWKNDMWLPKAIAKNLNYPKHHPWWNLLSNYSNADSWTTIRLWPAMEKEIKRRKLDKIYKERMKLIPIAWQIEHDAVTGSVERRNSMQDEFSKKLEKCERLCVNIAESEGFKLEIPKGSSNNLSLKKFVLEVLKLPVIRRTPKGEPSLDKTAIEYYGLTLDHKQPAYHFIKALQAKRKLGEALESIACYGSFCVPPLDSSLQEQEKALWFNLHPNINPTGTGTLRWSSNNPNSQNCSKQEGFTVRYMFGPLPDREWWSLDYQNIELRIPAYVAGEQAMIDLFEKPNDPPYFGSNHLLAAHILHPKLFEECVNDKGEVDGRIFKKRYTSTWYSWTKNGNFAVQYGAIESSGTADRAYHVQGAQAKIQLRLGKISDLNRQQIAKANKLGYVETIPDKTVDPERGYPLLCTRTENGNILPTVPLSYMIQSTAMWCTAKAMVRCSDKLKEWRKAHGFKAFITMQVHDEIVFDFPKGKINSSIKGKKENSNLCRVRELQHLMALSGDDIGIPLPVGLTYHPENWAKGEDV